MRGLLTTLVTGVFLLAGSSSALAGFLTVDRFEEQERGRNRPATSQPADDEPVPGTPWVHQIKRKALTNTAGNAGMSGAGMVAGSSHAPAAAAPVVPPKHSAQLIVTRYINDRIWLPPPFSSGVFRPPRA